MRARVEIEVVRGAKMLWIMMLAVLWPIVASARIAEPQYVCELGLQAGCGYYVGDAAPHIFTSTF